MLRGQFAVFAVERGHLGGQGPGIPAIVDARRPPAASRSSARPGPAAWPSALSRLSPSRAISRRTWSSSGQIHDQDAVHDALEMALDEERNHEDLIRARRRIATAVRARRGSRDAGSLRPCVASPRRRTAAGEAPRGPAARRDRGCRRRAPARARQSAGLPGRTTSRAIWSVSSTTAPRAAKSEATVVCAARDAAGEPDTQHRVQPSPANAR